MDLQNKLSNIECAAICGIGYQSETIAYYLNKVLNKDCVIIVNCFTQKPEDCFKIPSKRDIVRNSFSEVDMLMDTQIGDVKVKRFDMLAQEEIEKLIFIYSSDEESQSVYEKIEKYIGYKSCYLSSEEIEYINGCVWDNGRIIKNLWETNQYLYSEMHMLKNVLRRQLQSTVYDFHFEFHIVEHCNLKCAGCTHFSPLAKEEYLDLSEFEKDIKRLAELTGGNTRFINLLGGEPLLHPEICGFLNVARNAFPNTCIRVVTNGIKLLDMPQDFWDCCKENSIVIGITQYPIDVNYSKIILDIQSKGIKYESFSGEGYPRDEMWRLALDESASNRPIENFVRCPRANACIFVSHGKVFNCATMANVNHYNNCFGTNFELCKDDYVDIYSIKDVHDIFEKLCNPKPFCRFCNIDNRKYGVRWEKSQISPDEWL